MPAAARATAARLRSLLALTLARSRRGPAQHRAEGRQWPPAGGAPRIHAAAPCAPCKRAQSAENPPATCRSQEDAKRARLALSPHAEAVLMAQFAVRCAPGLRSRCRLCAPRLTMRAPCVCRRAATCFLATNSQPPPSWRAAARRLRARRFSRCARARGGSSPSTRRLRRLLPRPLPRARWLPRRLTTTTTTHLRRLRTPRLLLLLLRRLRPRRCPGRPRLLSGTSRWLLSWRRCGSRTAAWPSPPQPPPPWP